MPDFVWGCLVGCLVGGGICGILDWNKFWKGTYGNKEGYLRSLVGSMCEVAERYFPGEGRGKEKLAWVLGTMLVEFDYHKISFDADEITTHINKYVEDVINS